jgi:hypothetical protein
MYGSNDSSSTPENGAEVHTFVVKSGATGPEPMWWEVCAPTTREKALDIWHHLVELTPTCRPSGNRRLKVVETGRPVHS